MLPVGISDGYYFNIRDRLIGIQVNLPNLAHTNHADVQFFVHAALLY
jgi:hypothetical protein